MSNFDPNAILRGAQLTLVGAYRALQNPGLFKHEHYKQAARAVAAGIAIQIIISIPVMIAKTSIWTIDLFTNLEAATWDDQIMDSLHFLQHSVLQVPFFFMNLMKFMSPALDDMFMESLDWVDRTYVEKHQSENPQNLRAMYYPNLKLYDAKTQQSRRSKQKLIGFLTRYGRKAVLSLSILILSYTPYIGKLVLPVASFYAFRKAVGDKPAVAVFACGLVVPKRYFVKFLQSYFSSRSLMRELLEPYFSRLHFARDQKKKWFLDREGVLFGFGVGFFLMVKIPLVGVLIYGIAEASTAFLITKITDPPPPPQEAEPFVESQLKWKNKAEFLKLPLDKLDASNITGTAATQDPTVTTKSAMPSKKYT